MAKASRQQRLSQRRLDDAIISLVNDDMKFSESEYKPYFDKCRRWYDLYRGIYAGNYQGFRNNVSIPFLYSVVQSDVARKVQMSFGQFPYVSFEAYDPEDEPTAKKNELLISVQFEDAGMYSKAIDFFTCMDLYGVGITRDGWRQQRKQERVRVPHLIAPGVVEDRETMHWLTYFDGPDVEVIDPLDFFPQPGFNRVQDMDWCIQRYWRDLDNMIDQVHAEIESGEEPTYDLAALEDLAREQALDSSGYVRMSERLGVYRNANQYDSRRQAYKKPVEVWERWGYIPRELVGGDGVRCRRIVILNQKILGANTPTPYHHGQHPFGHCSIGDPHCFHGIGKSELLAKMQAASNRILNHKLDSLDLSISPTILVNSNSGIDSSRPLHLVPGKVIQIDGPTTDDFVRPLEMNLNGLQFADAAVEGLWRYMQQGAGIVEDTVSGGPSAREQTAREFQGRQEGVMTRLMMESRKLEEMWLEPLANRFRALNKQYLSLPKQIRMVGSIAVRDPITGMPLPPEDMEVQYEDLWPDYTARATGANQNMLRSAQRQDVIQLLQAAGSNPALMQMVNWGNFARQMFSTFGFRNINELLLDFAPVQQAQQMMMGMGGPVPGAPSGPGSAQATMQPENLNPGALPALGPLQ